MAALPVFFRVNVVEKVMTEHWSTPNGCHADCPACATAGAQVACVTPVIATVVRDKTMGNHALYVGNDRQWSSKMIDAGVLECVLGPAPFMLRNASVTLAPDAQFPDTLDACLSSDTDAVKTDTTTPQAAAETPREANTQYSRTGIPILPMNKKLAALQACALADAFEDSLGHLFDLIVHFVVKHKMVCGKQPRQRIMAAYDRYGWQAVPILPAEESQETVPQPATVVEPVVVTIVQDRYTYAQAMYVGDDLRQISGNAIQASAVAGHMDGEPVVLRFVLTSLGQSQSWPSRLHDCRLEACASASTTVVQDTVSRLVAIYVDGRLLRVEPYLTTYSCEPRMAITMQTSLARYAAFPKQLCDVKPLCAVEFPKAGTEPTPEKAAEPAKPSSREWAAAFVEKNNRFPHAIDYADAGYGTGSQCDCTTVGECVLRDACNGHHCDRNCYTQQLQDYIVMSSTKRAEPKQEDRPATVEDLLSRISKLESQCRNNGKVPAIVRIPPWAEGLLLQGVHNTDVRRELRWRAGSWRPHAIWGLQCIWETEELVVE